MGDAKYYLRSKTVWVNILGFSVAAANQIAPFMPPHVAGAIAAVLPIVNLGLRVITEQPITFSR
jgi:hypothetical protein